MEKPDFSVAGRENALFDAFYGDLGDEHRWKFNFARWTLLERVIWQFKTQNTYCHLDGFDLDQYHQNENGFVGIGRAWLLPERGTPGDIATLMAVEFDRDRGCVQRSSIWVGSVVPKRAKAPRVDAIHVIDFFSAKLNFGDKWVLAFEKGPHGWCHNQEFDLSIFLMRESGLDCTP